MKKIHVPSAKKQGGLLDRFELLSKAAMLLLRFELYATDYEPSITK
ncbi:hypothetical protein OQJ02_11855 [Legionella sp. PATHC032]|nr:hypothetical protein [Legionella sp. PATHC032]MCW8422324.1 hypothetical protein [Legionella sp. PATHC032]HAZ7574244.1 hypothetical protein [Legionella pneumophila]HBA1635790.1 hypothetical protein [Legionella pneumophila]